MDPFTLGALAVAGIVGAVAVNGGIAYVWDLGMRTMPHAELEAQKAGLRQIGLGSLADHY